MINDHTSHTPPREVENDHGASAAPPWWRRAGGSLAIVSAGFEDRVVGIDTVRDRHFAITVVELPVGVNLGLTRAIHPHGQIVLGAAGEKPGACQRGGGSLP